MSKISLIPLTNHAEREQATLMGGSFAQVYWLNTHRKLVDLSDVALSQHIVVIFTVMLRMSLYKI